MKPTIVLDTSAIIFSPNVFNQFPNHHVIVPIAVLNELDKLKKGFGEPAKNARVAIRLLDEISDKGDISTGILLDNNSSLKIDTTYIDTTISPYLGLGDPSYGDTQILACLISNWNQHSERDVCLISNDINLRVKAKSRGIDARSFEEKGNAFNEMYSGVQILTNQNACDELVSKGSIDPKKYDLDLCPHECVVSSEDPTILGHKVSSNKIKLIKPQYPWNISPMNTEQSLAIDLIMDKNIDLITLIGSAGTGKSLIVLACALELVLNKREYDKLIIYRPIQAVGADIGFLPGFLEEKLAPWFQAILDSFELLFSNGSGKTNKTNIDWKRDLEMYQKKGKIEMNAITYIRGRSINNAIIMIDESQNISTGDLKTILTRSGQNSKILLTGDISQIDSHNLDSTNNGLSYVIEKFKLSEIAGHITFLHGERSRLATIASEIL